MVCEEGTIQGCPLSMNFYGVATKPALCELRRRMAERGERWESSSFADDISGGGSADAGIRFFRGLQEVGPRVGVFPRAEKSWVVVKGGPTEAVRVQRAFAAAGLPVRVTAEGRRYLGAWVGTPEGERAFVANKAAEWAECVRAFAGVASLFPHEAYACVYRSLIAEWTYLLRVSPVAAEGMAAVEAAIAEALLPALAGRTVLPWERAVWGLPSAEGGWGLLPPTAAPQAGDPYRASAEAVSWLVGAIREGREYSRREHWRQVAKAQREYQERKGEWAKGVVERLERDAVGLPPGFPEASEARRRLHAFHRQREGRTGAWLQLLPSDKDNTVLSRGEWLDVVALRSGTELVEAPVQCDGPGCGRDFDVRHALSCKVGGLVHRRHNEVVECVQLQAEAGGYWTSQAALVRRAETNWESRVEGDGVEAEVTVLRVREGTRPNVNGAAAAAAAPMVRPGLEGDLIVRGMFNAQRDTIIDVRVFDAESASYSRMSFAAAARRHEKEKRDKYGAECRERRVDFSPFVVSMDGALGPGASAVMRELVLAIAKRTGRPMARVAGAVRAKVQLAVLRASVMCLRSPRMRRRPSGEARWGCAGGLVALGAAEEKDWEEACAA